MVKTRSAWIYALLYPLLIVVALNNVFVHKYVANNVAVIGLIVWIYCYVVAMISFAIRVNIIDVYNSNHLGALGKFWYLLPRENLLEIRSMEKSRSLLQRGCS